MTDPIYLPKYSVGYFAQVLSTLIEFCTELMEGVKVETNKTVDCYFYELHRLFIDLRISTFKYKLHQ